MVIKAVDVVRRIRDEHYRRTQGLSPEQRRAFYKAKADAARRKVRRLQGRPRAR